ncbi:MAG: hypothetical protein IJP77_06035 [Bacteroidales bacterium]|nr:hypothetical protein [Bacteroidales bacterium]
MKTNHTALERVGMALVRLVLNTEKIIFWHTGAKLPLLRRFHAWQSAQRQKELDRQKLLAL